MCGKNRLLETNGLGLHAGLFFPSTFSKHEHCNPIYVDRLAAKYKF